MRNYNGNIFKIGKKIFLDSDKPVFPIGTVIVKEKIIQPGDTKADSLGVMIKGQEGWEFAFVDQDQTITRDRKTLSQCYSCHEGIKDTDQVSRAYMKSSSHSVPNSSLPQ